MYCLKMSLSESHAAHVLLAMPLSEWPGICTPYWCIVGDELKLTIFLYKKRLKLTIKGHQQ